MHDCMRERECVLVRVCVCVCARVFILMCVFAPLCQGDDIQDAIVCVGVWLEEEVAEGETQDKESG